MRGVALCSLLALSGCMTGPNYLSRSVDDAWNNSYEDSPVGTALLTDVLPVYPIVHFLAWIPDFLILNPIQWWGSDIWDGKGAGFRHDQPSGSKKPFFK